MSDEKKTPEEELLAAYRRAQKHIVNTVKRSTANSLDEVVREVGNVIRLELHNVAEKNATFIRALDSAATPPRARLRQVNDTGGMITRSAYIELNSALSAASEDLMARLRKDIEPMSNRIKSLYDIKQTILDDFRRDGVLNVTYKNGHRVTLDKYVEMVTTSARNETDNDGAEQRAIEEGSDFVYMAPARNACPVCGSKGDRVYCISGRDPDFPKLYGDLWEGQYKSIHPHCRCRLVPWHKEQYTADELKRLTKSSNRPFVDRNGKPLDVQSEAARKQYTAQQDFNRKIWREQSEYEYYKSRYGAQFPYSTLGGYRRARRANSSELSDWLDKHVVQQTTEGVRVRTGNSSDKRQYERWTAILGAERMPGSLDKFRDLKYNKPAEFKALHIDRDCALFQSKVRGGEIALNLRKGKQEQHLQSTGDKSRILADISEIQRVIRKYAGHGYMDTADNKAGPTKEIVDIPDLVGRVKDISGEWIETHRFKIHYSKKGVHLVPTLREIKNGS